VSRNNSGIRSRLTDLLKIAILGDAAGIDADCSDAVCRSADAHGVSALIYSAFAAKKKTPRLTISVRPTKRP
jgi:hypothetical protein